MRILITGGAGLIGQAIAKRHLEAGDDVYIYDTQINKYNDYSNLVGKDLTWTTWDKASLPKSIYTILCENEPFDIISNQAARVGVGQSQYYIEDYVFHNDFGTAKLIQCVVDSKRLPKLILHAGSMGPYGDAPYKLAVDEGFPKNPQSVYAVTKLAQEELLKVFSYAYGIPVVSLRYFSVYGTEQNPLNPYTGVLSIIANQLINNDKVELYDTGEQTRDLIHVEDVAEAHFLASRLENFSGFTPINIGTGKSHSIKSIAYLMEHLISNRTKDIVFNGKRRSGDIRHMMADISLAKKLLGWEPKHNLVEDIKAYCKYVLYNKEKFMVNTVKEEQENIIRKGLLK